MTGIATNGISPGGVVLNGFGPQARAAVTGDGTTLPRLREDLALLPGPPAPDGAPTWTIHDPARDRYLRIGWEAMEMLARWRLGRAAAVARAVAAETTARVSAADVEGLVHFLRVNDLLTSDDPAAVARLLDRHARRRAGLLQQAVHNYLFFRIPLIRPDRFLRATQHLVAPFYAPAWRWLVLAAMLAGLFLASRQWDRFVEGAAALASWQGAAVLVVTLCVVKVLHEFGHAYTARRYGCAVPSMGVAFLVLWPVLYTDTTHAYRLVSRRQRLRVAAGGIMVELTIAALATLAWALLPDGALRTGAQAAATITWIGTLAINLNPFMRFDGYYLLADALGIANLQDRAFAQAKWWLRERLFGLGEAPPEPFAPRLRRFLVAYAVATWLYRLLLFLGIALLVYGLVFKLLGIVLMLVELVWFVAMPICREIRAWWSRRHAVRLNRNTAITLVLAAGLVAAAAWPWSWPVAAPAVVLPAGAAAIHAPVPARLAALHVADGAPVAAGALLLSLDLPDLDFQVVRAERRILALDDLIGSEAAVTTGTERVGVLREELAATRTQLRGLLALREDLILRAPMAGRIVDLAEPLVTGQWLQPGLLLGRVVAAGPPRVVAYVAADDLARIRAGARARFLGDDPAAAALPLVVRQVDGAAVSALDQPMLAASHGGPIPVATEAVGASGHAVLRPLAPVYRVVLAPMAADGQPAHDGPAALRSLRGRVWIDGPPVSLAERAWRTAAAVLLRESGF